MTKTTLSFQAAHTYIAHIRKFPPHLPPQAYNKRPHCESDTEDIGIEEMIVKTD